MFVLDPLLQVGLYLHEGAPHAMVIGNEIKKKIKVKSQHKRYMKYLSKQIK